MEHITTRILKYCEMSWESLTKLKVFMRLSRTFRQFDPQDFQSPSMTIAEASVNGEPIVFCPLERIYLVRSYAVNPACTETQARAAGDHLDATITHLAKRDGVSKVMLVKPHGMELPGDDWEELTVFVRRIANPIHLQGLGCSITPQATQYLN